jgi:phage terminase Nu1 subunit (DNA packaging protein)
VLLDRVMPLTRSQVAQRLGRSIATVRALEERGVLNPRRGRRGRRLFDVDQVDKLVADAAATGRVLAPGEAAHSHGTSGRGATIEGGAHRDLVAARRQIAVLERSGAALRAELDCVRAQIVEVVEEILKTAPRRPSLLAALERLLNIAVTR